MKKEKNSCHAELVSASQSTLHEIPNQVQGDVSGNRKGFTLAEVLITLLVIGVVAVLTIPSMITGIKDKVLQRQRETANAKILEGFRQMRVDGKLMERYGSTSDFVNEMQKYFKIAEICDNEHLQGCFIDDMAYFEYFNTTVNDDGTKKNGATKQKKLEDIKDIKKINSKAYENYDNFMGVKLADGVNMLIAYDTSCTGPADGDTNVGKEDVGEMAECFAYFIDVNASQGPNTKNRDIISNVAFAREMTTPFSPKAISYEECENYRNPDHPDYNEIFGETVQKGCCNSTNCPEGDFWAGAVYECATKGMKLPSLDELATIANQLYGRTDIAKGTSKSNLDGYKDTILKVDLGLSDSEGTWFFSSEEYSIRNSYWRVFSSSDTSISAFSARSDYANSNRHSSTKAFCLGDDPD